MEYASAVLDQMWIARWALASGLLMTVTISLLSVLSGTILGVGVGMALTYGARPLYWLVRAYTDFIRGTPVLVLVLASYYVLSTVGLQLSPFQAGVLALAVFCSSHVGEIVRGALQAIPRGQGEAAKAIGLTFDVPHLGFFARSKRYSLLAEDGVVTKFNPETGTGCEISAGEHLLAQL